MSEADCTAEDLDVQEPLGGRRWLPGDVRSFTRRAGTRLTCSGTRVIEARVPHFLVIQRLRIRFHLSVISGVIQ
jgi:hypothetical protein